jgi:hypothetical protein
LEPTNIALEHEKLRPELERTTKLLADIRGCSVEELNARELATLQDFANRVWRLRGQHESDERVNFANEVTPPRGIRARKRPARTKPKS